MVRPVNDVAGGPAPLSTEEQLTAQQWKDRVHARLVSVHEFSEDAAFKLAAAMDPRDWEYRYPEDAADEEIYYACT